MSNAVAFANNDVITVAWSYDARPDGCMGFAVYRVDEAGKETPLPSHAVFKGYTIQQGQTTEAFPIQKFYWKDPYARLVAEKTGKRRFRYKIVPLTGKPGALVPMQDLPFLVSNEVELTDAFSRGVRAYFNRGLISTQRVSRAFKGKPGATSLRARVADPGDPLRASLSGDMLEALTGFVARAAKSGTIHAALYELGDPELVACLEGLGSRLQLVLSNSVVADPESGEKGDGNQPARQRLEAAGAGLWNRLMPAGHIGHDKFLVHLDATGTPRAVLLGSTNWTSTGLCTQTNNTVIVEDEGLAARYLAAWRKLAADTDAAGGTARALQGRALRAWCARGQDLSLASGEAVESWFSPNTPGPRKKGPGEQRPPDMAALVARLERARHAILFLAFYPGAPSIANWSAAALKARPDLFVRGCVTNTSASEGFSYELQGVIPPPKVKGERAPPRQDPRVIAAEAFDGKVIPEGWQKELLRAGFAVIHDKIVVVDPFADDGLVVTGSHNLGYKASYDNDENLVFIEGNRKLAVAYATHVLDVYDHFAWRYQVKLHGEKKASQLLKDTPRAWLDQYFRPDGTIQSAQLRFWLQARG